MAPAGAPGQCCVVFLTGFYLGFQGSGVLGSAITAINHIKDLGIEVNVGT